MARKQNLEKILKNSDKLIKANKKKALPNSSKDKKEKVYKLLRQIPKGAVTSYGEIARKLKTKGFRAIGKIVSQNRNIPETPCHRVVCANGEISGYAFGVDKKIALLKKEGVIVKNNKIVNFKEKFYRF